MDGWLRRLRPTGGACGRHTLLRSEELAEGSPVGPRVPVDHVFVASPLDYVRLPAVLLRELVIEGEGVRVVDSFVPGPVHQQYGRGDAPDALDVGERVTQGVHADGRAASARGAAAGRWRNQEAQTREDRRVQHGPATLRFVAR